MKPRNEDNFLIEVTPEIMSEINRLWMHSEEEPVTELHHSPYWGKLKEEVKANEKDGDE